MKLLFFFLKVTPWGSFAGETAMWWKHKNAMVFQIKYYCVNFSTEAYLKLKHLKTNIH